MHRIDRTPSPIWKSLAWRQTSTIAAFANNGSKPTFPSNPEEVSEAINTYECRELPDAAFQSIRTILRDADPTLPIAYFRTLDEQVNRSLTTERMLRGDLRQLRNSRSPALARRPLWSHVVCRHPAHAGDRHPAGAGSHAMDDSLDGPSRRTDDDRSRVAVALPCVWALGRLVESQLYDLKPTDPATILAATLILCSAALIAAWIPARRASAVSPTEALRFE